MAKGTWIALGVLAGIGLVVAGILGSAVGTYNSFVDEETAVDAQSKQVDVQYQTAFRLIPQLLNLTEQYMQNEKDILVSVAALRSGLALAGNSTDFEVKNSTMAETFQLMAIIGARLENYPTLQQADLIRSTMLQITNVETKIQVEKVRYNDKVETYNAHRRKCCMPLMVANILGFEEKEFIGFSDRPNQTSFGNNTV